jgi:hypothetical protein
MGLPGNILQHFDFVTEILQLDRERHVSGPRDQHG